MKRVAMELRRLTLRHNLVAAARAHAAEHGLSARAAVKEAQAAAGSLDASDLEQRPASPNPLIPAYRVRGPNGAMLVQFRCPVCKGVHSHGLPGLEVSPLQYRGSHCDEDFGKSQGYRLLVVGWSRGDDLPECSASEIDALNGVIREST